MALTLHERCRGGDLDSARDQLIAWLNDAYAMEQGLIPILQKHAGDARELTPQTSARLEQHVTETLLHAERLVRCLRELGAEPSALRSTISFRVGAAESVATSIFRDQQVKAALLDDAAEHFEVGCYHALSTAARQLGYEKVADLSDLNVREDEAMAHWLRSRLAAVVARTLQTQV
jgi:ferritin-like metal-binding protein YciE